MALALIGPADSSNQSNLNPLIGESYNLKLTKLVQSLLAEIGNENNNVSKFIQEFYKLMQARIDPPLESIWVYAALTFRCRFDPKVEPLGRIEAVKQLFQFLSACSSSCSSYTSIALLVTVVYEVYKVVVGLFGKDLKSKKERKVMKEVKSLMEVILGYLSVSCCMDLVKEGELKGSKLLVPFSDLVRLWMDSDVGLESFLPLVNGEVFGMVSEGGCDVGYLAGAVMVELFLLKLCLNLKSGTSKGELAKEMRIWAIGSITGFSSFYFFETLVRMLLEKTLPVTSLLSSEDEVFLREVLYDAVILVDYSFLNPERTIHQPVDKLRSLAMARLIVTHEAAEFFREHGDQKRSISYLNAFSMSSLPSQIIRWIKNQIHVEESANKSYGSSPKALIKWLLTLENQGVRVFDEGSLKNHAKLVLDNSKSDIELSTSKSGSKSLDDLFFVDNKGEALDADEDDAKTNGATNDAFVAAAHSMKLTENGERKRKGGTSSEKKKNIKFHKYEPLLSPESPSERLQFINSDDLNSGSEVENPSSDEDTE
ncbi:hypothetical protein UlMin_022622 [Ulmus minor]